MSIGIGTITIPIFTIITICVSFITIFVAWLNYRRKSGICVRGTYSLASSRSCNDEYVSSITLENLKDRAITIFEIFLKVGNNYYIIIEDFPKKPLVLKAFETYQKEYGPIEFYGINTKRINLNNLLKNREINQQLILSTSDGKYKVQSSINRWSPIIDSFKNNMTAVIRPVVSIYKKKYLGENIKYVVELKGGPGEEVILPIHAKDYELRMFKHFSLTKDSLESKEVLEHFLQKQLKNGRLTCKNIFVYDLNTWRTEAHEFYSGKIIDAKCLNAFQYFIFGRILTIYSDWKIKRKNRKRNRTN